MIKCINEDGNDDDGDNDAADRENSYNDRDGFDNNDDN